LFTHHFQSYPTQSIGQFRPEKNHKLQIEAVATLLKQHPQHADRLKLLLIGSCRNTEDEQRVEELRGVIKALKVEQVVAFSINPTFPELLDSMKKASIGIHTMRQEHFGIGIVEMMAAGLLVIAHDSGGPQTDIVKHQTTGFLATYADDYAQAIRQALEMSEPDACDMRSRAQQSALRFSDEVFDDSFNKTVAKLLQ
jgi:alpha-1,2-mannosyltransferase